ncbi:hypothetical protein UVI_02016060 [Ustilaginoidea virens]|nr:hypothetical protein UVI_02016060 [Ustilaginoidea virens]
MPHHLLRQRDKPLRTYGKRSTSTPEARGEPRAKKPRLGPTPPGKRDANPAPALVVPSEQSKEEPCQCRERQPSPLPGSRAAARPSILQYFKPVTAVPKVQQVQPDGNKEHGGNGPRDGSPPVRHARAARSRTGPRILRIRATSVLSEQSSRDAADGDEIEGNALSAGKGNRLRGEAILQSQGRKDSPALGGASLPARSHSKHSPVVQTTLNISSRAAFAECKLCDTVWNPLYPDDVKYHEKRHKTVVRARARKMDEL